MSQPLITWVMLALIAGILIGAAINERWHRTAPDHDYLDRPIHYIARCPEHGLHGQRGTCYECGGPVEQIPMVELERDRVEGGSIEWPTTTADFRPTGTIRVGHEWGEIDAAATRAAYGATSAALARGRSMDLGEAGAAVSRTLQYDIDAGVRARRMKGDPKVRAILDAITAGLRADTERTFREAAGFPLLTVTCDRVDSQAAPFLLGDADFRRLVGCDRQAILRGLGFADAAG